MGTPPALGILGGIFDPIHNGHLATAQLALDYFHLQQMFLIPAGVPPHKTTANSSAEHRLAMLKRAVGNYPGFSVWDGELNRQGTSYTVDTLRALKKEFPGTQLYFIIGSDNLNEVQCWHNYQELFSLATMCVAHRPGFSMTITDPAVSFAFTSFPSSEWKLSSTMLRTYLAKGYSCNGLVPGEVLDYIQSNRLYSA